MIDKFALLILVFLSFFIIYSYLDFGKIIRSKFSFDRNKKEETPPETKNKNNKHSFKRY